jgi:hypothetical protein
MKKIIQISLTICLLIVGSGLKAQCGGECGYCSETSNNNWWCEVASITNEQWALTEVNVTGITGSFNYQTQLWTANHVSAYALTHFWGDCDDLQIDIHQNQSTYASGTLTFSAGSPHWVAIQLYALRGTSTVRATW